MEKPQNALPPIKITIKPDDFKDISNALEDLTEADRQRLGDAIRDQEVGDLTTADTEFIGIVAYFAKITNEQRDKILIKTVLNLDNADLAYLVSEFAPPDGVMKCITSYTITREQQHQEEDATPVETGSTSQPDFFPDLKPDPPTTLTVNYDEQRVHSNKANISISKAAQVITKVINKELTPIRITPRTAKRSVITNVTLTTDLPEGVATVRPISFFDRIVEDAIGNLFDQDFTKVTPEMVYRQINGITGTKPVSKTAAAKVDRSIRRLARTWITIDFTEQLKLLTKDKLAKGEIQGNIINANNVLLRFADGTIKSGWQIKDTPKIYHYSKVVKQIATIPTALLDTRDATRSTDELIAAKYYLIGQIERIKRKPDNPKILFDSLFDAIGDDLAKENRVIKKRRIAAIVAILDHFKKSGYIVDYEVEKQRGGKVEGVVITVPDKKKTIEDADADGRKNGNDTP